MRISDWSSDVCSSDLQGEDLAAADVQVDRLERLEARGVGLAECLDRDDGLHAGSGDVRRGWVPASGCTAYGQRSEEHTSELQSLMRISYAVFCLQKKTQKRTITYDNI